MIKVIEEVFDSSLTQRRHSFKALVPECGEDSGVDHPVLYLLHGLFGSSANWLELTGLQSYLKERELIVILPDGGDKWYTDGASAREDKFETSLIEELIPTVEKKFKASGRRERRAVAGLSMGGYGALKLALKRPELFAFAASMSGALNAARIVESTGEPAFEELLPSLREVFGDDRSATRIENDLFAIARKIGAEAAAAMPYIYFDCGCEDGFLEVNRSFAALLGEKNMAFEYREIPGGHDWDYWDRRLGVIIEKTAKIFNQTSR